MSGTVKVLNVKLQRADHNVSWGFNVQGGIDFGAPLSVGHVHPQSLAEKAQVLQDDFVLRIGGMSTQHMTHAQARDAILQQADYLEMTLQRGGAPRSEDYTSRYEFPKHQLMNPNNIEYVPVASPQVGIQLGGNRALLTQSYNSPMGLYSSKNLADTLVSTLNNMHMNDPKLISAAQQIKPKPDFAQPASNASHHTNPKPQIKVNQNVSKASIALTKPTNSNQNSANYPSSYGYMQPAMYQQQHQPQPQPYYQPYSPPPPPPRPVYQPPPPPPVQSYRPPPQNQMNRGNRGPATYNHAPPTNTKMPSCASCHQIVRGPFISAVGKIWCPDHFVCARPGCGTNLHNVGFIEEGGKLYCEHDFANYMANTCQKCGNKIVGECCYALDKTYHPECFTCGHCKQKIGSGSFHIEDGVIYCSKDFAAMFSVKCAGCEFPIEPLDKFFEALGQKYHTECFICSKCNVPLNGSYVAKGNKPYCKRHAY